MGNGVLPVRGARGIVERALQDTISLALRRRGPVSANLVALAAAPTIGAGPTTALVDGDLRFVTTAGVCYVWRESATSGGVQPNDRVASGKPGMWFATSSPIIDPTGAALSTLTTGYLKAVAIYQGETSDQDWDTRIFAHRPAVLIQYVGESGEQKSNLRGAIKIRYYHFAIWAISFNARGGYEAALGSPVTSEAAIDPGVSNICDDLEDLLDGLTGGQMLTDGIDHLRLQDFAPKIERGTGTLPQRLFVWQADLDVRATVGKEDRPPRHTFDTATATGVDPDDGVTPVTPTSQIIP